MKKISEDYFSWTDQTADKPTINTAQLEGDAQCPHCYAETAFAMCGCGNLMCYDGYSEYVVCPWCHRQVSFTISSGVVLTLRAGKVNYNYLKFG